MKNFILCFSFLFCTFGVLAVPKKDLSAESSVDKYAYAKCVESYVRQERYLYQGYKSTLKSAGHDYTRLSAENINDFDVNYSLLPAYENLKKLQAEKSALKTRMHALCADLVVGHSGFYDQMESFYKRYAQAQIRFIEEIHLPYWTCRAYLLESEVLADVKNYLQGSTDVFGNSYQEVLFYYHSKAMDGDIHSDSTDVFPALKAYREIYEHRLGAAELSCVQNGLEVYVKSNLWLRDKAELDRYSQLLQAHLTPFIEDYHNQILGDKMVEEFEQYLKENKP